MKYQAEPGDSIYIAARKAIKLAKQNFRDIELIFNEIAIRVSPNSFDCDIAMIYGMSMELKRLQNRR